MLYVGLFGLFDEYPIYFWCAMAACALLGVVLLGSTIFWCMACGAIRERYRLRRRFLATAQVNVKQLEGQQPIVLDGLTPGSIAENCAVCGAEVPPRNLSCKSCHAVCLDRLCINAFKWRPIAEAPTAAVAAAPAPSAATPHDVAVAGIQAALGADDADDEKSEKNDDKSEKSDGSSEGKCCSICLDELAEGDLVVALPCLHIFHEQCIAGWLKTQFTCAECSVPVV